MSVNANSLTVAASVGWTQSASNSPFAETKQGPDSLAFSATPSATTYGEVLLHRTTIAAAANETVDFRSFTNKLNQSVTATKVVGWLIKATGATGQLKIEPGASDPLSWFLSGTTPALTLSCGTDGCCIMVMDGAAATIDATTRNVKFSNPGAATITLTIAALVGTT